MTIEDPDLARLAEVQRRLPRLATAEDVARHLGRAEPLPEAEVTVTDTDVVATSPARRRGRPPRRPEGEQQ